LTALVVEGAGEGLGRSIAVGGIVEVMVGMAVVVEDVVCSLGREDGILVDSCSDIDPSTSMNQCFEGIIE